MRPLKETPGEPRPPGPGPLHSPEWGVPPQLPRLSSRIPGPGAPHLPPRARAGCSGERPLPSIGWWPSAGSLAGRELPGALAGKGLDTGQSRGASMGRTEAALFPAQPSSPPVTCPPFLSLEKRENGRRTWSWPHPPGRLSRSPVGPALPPPTSGCLRGWPRRARGSKQSCPPLRKPLPKG